MSLRSKVFLSVGMVLTASFLLINQLFIGNIDKEFLGLEQREVKINTDRVIDALQNKIDEQAAKIGDWAQWDDTYAFITDRNEGYIQSNLQNSSFSILHVDMVVLTDLSGNIIFQKYVHDGEEGPFPESFAQHLTADIAAGEMSKESGAIHSEIIHIPEGVVITTVRPVTSSDGTADPNGFIVFARFFDENIVSDISRITHVVTEYAKYDAALLDGGFLEAREHLTDEKPFYIGYSGEENTVFGYTWVKNDSGNPVLLLRVRMNRDIYIAGKANATLFTRIIIVAGVLFIIVIFSLLQWLVLRKVLSLSSQVGKIRDVDTSEQHVFLPGKDEFSQLAGDINTMLTVLHERSRFLEDTRRAISNILEDMIESENNLKKQTEELQKFQRIADTTFDHTIITDADGVIVYANHAAEVLTGYSKEEMIGAKPSLWGKQMPREFYETLWKTIKEERQPYVGELTNVRKGVGPYLASIRIAPVIDEKEDVQFFVGVERDITEERRVQLRIIQHSDELEAANILIAKEKDRAESILRFLRSIGEGVFATDTMGDVIFMNDAAERVAGRSSVSTEDTVGSASFAFVRVVKSESSDFHIVGEILKCKCTVFFPPNTFLVEKRGNKVPVSGTGSPIFDGHNNIIGTIVVFRDITKLRELDEMKDNFLSIAAHQLRTPLGSMRWSTELLMGGDYGKLPKAAIEVVRQLYDNSVRMVLLVNDLLDVSRIDADKGREEKKLVDIRVVIGEVLRTMSPEAEKRSVKITFDSPEDIPHIMAPPKHLYEALENLVSNGIKYNRENGSLHIVLKKEKQAVSLSVADTGIGIPKSDTSKVFSKFFRSANATLKETEGSGLGLSVVKSYLEESNATITFESTENVGTTFFIEFPLKS